MVTGGRWRSSRLGGFVIELDLNAVRVSKEDLGGAQVGDGGGVVCDFVSFQTLEHRIDFSNPESNMVERVTGRFTRLAPGIEVNHGATLTVKPGAGRTIKGRSIPVLQAKDLERTNASGGIVSKPRTST